MTRKTIVLVLPLGVALLACSCTHADLWLRVWNTTPYPLHLQLYEKWLDCDTRIIGAEWEPQLAEGEIIQPYSKKEYPWVVSYRVGSFHKLEARNKEGRLVFRDVFRGKREYEILPTRWYHDAYLFEQIPLCGATENKRD